MHPFYTCYCPACLLLRFTSQALSFFLHVFMGHVLFSALLLLCVHVISSTRASELHMAMHCVIVQKNITTKKIKINLRTFIQLPYVYASTPDEGKQKV